MANTGVIALQGPTAATAVAGQNSYKTIAKHFNASTAGPSFRWGNVDERMEVRSSISIFVKEIFYK